MIVTASRMAFSTASAPTFSRVSVAAAQRATELGLQAYNILEGFEGDPDAQAHRGQLGGWRKRGLPWQQS